MPTVDGMAGPSESVKIDRPAPPVTKVANRGDKDRMVLARQRDLKALQLKLDGCTFAEMATQMGFNDESQAYRVWQRAMARSATAVSDEWRELENARLEALWAIMFAKAKTGSHLAVDRCLMIMDRRAKLYGLDAPVKKFIEVAGMNQLVEAVTSLEQSNADMERRIAARMVGLDDDDEAIDAILVDESPGDGPPALETP